MALFLIAAAPDSSAAIEGAIRAKYPDAHFLIEPGQWLVTDFGKTAEQVWGNLGFGPQASGGVRGIVVGVGSYWGHHKRDLWPWMKEQLERQNG